MATNMMACASCFDGRRTAVSGGVPRLAALRPAQTRGSFRSSSRRRVMSFAPGQPRPRGDFRVRRPHRGRHRCTIARQVGARGQTAGWLPARVDAGKPRRRRGEVFTPAESSHPSRTGGSFVKQPAARTRSRHGCQDARGRGRARRTPRAGAMRKNGLPLQRLLRAVRPC